MDIEKDDCEQGKDDKEAKLWLDLISLAKVRHFWSYKLNDIERILKDYQSRLLEAWQKEKKKRGDR